MLGMGPLPDPDFQSTSIGTLSRLQVYAGKEAKLVQRFQGPATLSALSSIGSQCLSSSFSAARVFAAVSVCKRLLAT